MVAETKRWKQRITGYGEEAPDQLLANPRNWRMHPGFQQDALSGVLAEVGVVQNVIVNQRTGHLVDGHLRVTLALRSDQPSIPVTYVDLSEDEEALILATLDPVAALAATDAEQLTALLEDVSTQDAAVRKMLDDLLAESGVEIVGDGLTDPDAVPEPPKEPITKPGDLWLLGEHRLLCGDSTVVTDVDRLMVREKAACVFTSPPYAVGLDYGDTYKDSIQNLRRLIGDVAPIWLDVIEPGGYAVVNFGDVASARDIAGTEEPCEYPMALEYWPVFRSCGFVLWSRRIWCKPNARVNSLQCINSNRAATDWEHVWTWKTPGKSRIERVGGISQMGWFDSTREDGVAIGKETHGAGMAAVVAVRALEVHTNPGEIVHEPFTGTGTTVIAAEQTGRRCFGIEVSPAYVDVCVTRWEQFTGKTATLEARP